LQLHWSAVRGHSFQQSEIQAELQSCVLARMARNAVQCWLPITATGKAGSRNSKPLDESTLRSI